MSDESFGVDLNELDAITARLAVAGHDVVDIRCSGLPPCS